MRNRFRISPPADHPVPPGPGPSPAPGPVSFGETSERSSAEVVSPGVAMSVNRHRDTTLVRSGHPRHASETRAGNSAAPVSNAPPRHRAIPPFRPRRGRPPVEIVPGGPERPNRRKPAFRLRPAARIPLFPAPTDSPISLPPGPASDETSGPAADIPVCPTDPGPSDVGP